MGNLDTRKSPARTNSSGVISPVVVKVDTWEIGVMYSRKSRKDDRVERSIVARQIYVIEKPL